MDPNEKGDPMTIRRNITDAPLSAAVAVGTAVAVAVYALAYALLPRSRETLITEDGIIETTTALVFLAAALAGAVAMVRRKPPARFWLVPAFGLFGFLDEMSFGARIFGYPLPVIDGMEVDSFHDLFDLADRFAGDLGVSRTAIAAVLAAGCLVLGAFLMRSRRLSRVAQWMSAHRPIALLGGAVGLLLAGIALDLLGTTDLTTFAEETAEFAASGLVAVAAADLISVRPARAADRRDRLQEPTG